jgi:hypothetical protein
MVIRSILHESTPQGSWKNKRLPYFVYLLLLGTAQGYGPGVMIGDRPLRLPMESKLPHGKHNKLVNETMKKVTHTSYSDQTSYYLSACLAFFCEVPLKAKLSVKKICLLKQARSKN